MGKTTPEEIFEMQNARLDRQIALQEKMKDILDDKQYETWKKFTHHKKMHGSKRMQERGLSLIHI